jgi:hypothetical protein
MDERLKSIARLLDGEKMAVVCRQFPCLAAAARQSPASPIAGLAPIQNDSGLPKDLRVLRRPNLDLSRAIESQRLPGLESPLHSGL